MEVPETVFEIIFNIVRAQNDALLREIAVKENIPVRDLMKTFSTNKRHLREFMNQSSSKSENLGNS
jgi:hypothetical protein